MEINREELNHFLQHTDSTDLKELVDKVICKHQIELIQKPSPQTLLVPVHDPVSNTEFYAGEVLVTAALVTVEKENGWGMAMDDNSELALQLAILDGAWAAQLYLSEIRELAKDGKRNLMLSQDCEQEMVAETRVSFDLL